MASFRGQTKRVRGDGVDLAVYERGPSDAPTLVLVHGYPDDHRVWDGVVDALAERFHVVTYDVRGAGASTAPTSREGYRLPHLAADLRAVIESTNKRAHVVGHDWGSIQSWELVTDEAAKDLLASFTSISGPCLDHVGHWMRTGRGIAGQLLKSWYIGVFQVPALPELAWRSGIGSRLLSKLEDGGAPSSREDAVRGVELYRANMPERLRAPRERHAQTPVQIVLLQDDKYVSPDIARTASRWTTDLRVRELPGGHWTMRTHPEPIARVVEEMAGAC